MNPSRWFNSSLPNAQTSSSLCKLQMLHIVSSYTKLVFQVSLSGFASCLSKLCTMDNSLSLSASESITLSVCVLLAAVAFAMFSYCVVEFVM